MKFTQTIEELRAFVDGYPCEDSKLALLLAQVERLEAILELLEERLRAPFLVPGPFLPYVPPPATTTVREDGTGAPPPGPPTTTTSEREGGPA